MGGWLRQLALSAQVRAGVSAQIVIWGVVAAVASGVAAIFLVIAAFVWLSHRYGITIASLTLGIFFLVLALVAFFACAMVRRRNIQRAQRELEMHKAANANLFDPKLLSIGYQIGDDRVSQQVFLLSLVVPREIAYARSIACSRI